jgi:hypothetical protein
MVWQDKILLRDGQAKSMRFHREPIVKVPVTVRSLYIRHRDAMAFCAVVAAGMAVLMAAMLMWPAMIDLMPWK